MTALDLVSAIVFCCALATGLVVIVSTVVPKWWRIVTALRGEPARPAPPRAAPAAKLRFRAQVER